MLSIPITKDNMRKDGVEYNYNFRGACREAEDERKKYLFVIFHQHCTSPVTAANNKS